MAHARLRPMLALVLVAALLVGCGKHHGTIVAKRHAPSHAGMLMIGGRPMAVTVQGEYYLVIQTKGGKKVQIQVTKANYEKVRVGDER